MERPVIRFVDNPVLSLKFPNPAGCTGLVTGHLVPQDKLFEPKNLIYILVELFSKP